MDALRAFVEKDRCAAYFTVALLLFIASFLFLPTAKMVNNLYYALLAVPGLLVLASGRRRIAPLAPDVLLWGALLGWFAIVGIWSGDAQHYKHILYVALYLLIVGRLIDPAPLRREGFARGLFWVLGGYVLGSALIYWATGRYAVGERVLWLPARMTGPIYTSIWLACCFALALPVWVRRQRWAEMVAALVLAVFCMGFVLQSRSGLVALAVLLLAVAVYLSQRQARYSLWLTGALLGSACLGLLLGSEVPAVAGLFARADAGRWQLWSILVGEWLDCGLWLGCGVKHRTVQMLASGQSIPHPHSIFLSLGVFGGLVALLIFLALMGAVLHRAWRHRDPWGLYLLAGLVGLNFDGTKLIGNPDELWLLVLLPAALIGNPRGSPPAGPHTGADISRIN